MVKSWTGLIAHLDPLQNGPGRQFHRNDGAIGEPHVTDASGDRDRVCRSAQGQLMPNRRAGRRADVNDREASAAVGYRNQRSRTAHAPRISRRIYLRPNGSDLNPPRY